jgi:hypothetical protein
MSDPRGPLDEWFHPVTDREIKILHEFAARVAANFETRAKQIATHNQRSHTSNTQQRKNMEIMFQVWTDAAAYVRAQIKGPTNDKDKAPHG